MSETNGAIFVTLNHHPSTMADSYVVVGVRAVTGAATRFELYSPSRSQVVTTDSVVVHFALVTAYMVGADIEVELEDPPSSVVHRVFAFAAASEPRRCHGHLRVMRIATQRVKGVDHLEVFLAEIGDDKETAYNVYEPLMQQLLAAVFQYRETPTCRLGLDVQTRDGEIIEVSLGDAPR